MLWETMTCLHMSNHIQRIFLKKVFHVNCRKPLSYSALFSLVCLFHACGFRYLYSVGNRIFVYKPKFSWIHISIFWLSPSVSLRQQTELMFALPAQPWCVPCFSEWHYCPPGRSSQKPGNQSGSVTSHWSARSTILLPNCFSALNSPLSPAATTLVQALIIFRFDPLASSSPLPLVSLKFTSQANCLIETLSIPLTYHVTYTEVPHWTVASSLFP